MGGEQIKTPSGIVNSDKVIFNKAGFYEYGQKTAAANLANIKESDINSGTSVKEYEQKFISSSRQEFFSKKTYEFELALLIFALILSELLFIKFRGDL